MHLDSDSGKVMMVMALRDRREWLVKGKRVRERQRDKTTSS